MAKDTITINRAPVLTLWASIVAERLGHSRPEALTLGKAVAGLNAQSKGKRLGIYEEKKEGPKEKETREDKAAPLQNNRKSLRQRLPTWPVATWITRARSTVMADT